MNNVRLVNVNPRRYDLCNLPLTVISRTLLHFGFYGTAITMLKLRLTVTLFLVGRNVCVKSVLKVTFGHFTHNIYVTLFTF